MRSKTQLLTLREGEAPAEPINAHSDDHPTLGYKTQHCRLREINGAALPPRHSHFRRQNRQSVPVLTPLPPTPFFANHLNLRLSNLIPTGSTGSPRPCTQGRGAGGEGRQYGKAFHSSFPRSVWERMSRLCVVLISDFRPLTSIPSAPPMSTATATQRVFNFSPGPAVLPLPVLEQAAR